MKSLNNYINERLNPRHLGQEYDFNKYFSIPGKLSWRSLDETFGDYEVKCGDWYCMKADTSLTTYLLFYSSESKYIFYIDTKNIKHHPGWWGRVEYDKQIFTEPEYVYVELLHNFHTYTMVSGGAESIDKTIYPKEVGRILDAFKKYIS